MNLIKDSSLNEKQAYMAMFFYLEELYNKTKSDDLAGFLGSMVLLKDGKPVDSAVWADWKKAIEKAKKS